jgi:hypothetical protein
MLWGGDSLAWVVAIMMPLQSIIFKLWLSLSSYENAGGLELAGHLKNKTPLNLNAPLNLLLGTSDRYHNRLQI